MQNEDNILPLDIQDLLRICHNAMEIEHGIVSRKVFYETLRKATTAHENTPIKEVQSALLKCWLIHMDYLLYNVRAPEVYYEDIDQFIHLIIKGNHLGTILDNNKHENLLAGICMVRVYLSECTYTLPNTNHVGTLVEQWLGKSMPANTLECFEDFVGQLYGPAAWTLFRDEVTRTSEFPVYLCKLGLSLPYVRKTAESETMGTGLPIDLT